MSRSVLAVAIHVEITALWAAPPQGQTLDSWFAIVVGRRIVEPRSLSIIGSDTLAHTHANVDTKNKSPLTSLPRAR